MPEGGMAAKALPMAMQGMQGAKGAGGGGAGGKGGQGGISPEQKALIQYMEKQQLLKQRSDFANTGTGLSTMSSYAGAGPRFGAAQAEAQQSDTNQAFQQQQQNELLNIAQRAQGQQNQQQQQAGVAAGIQSGATTT